MLGHLRRLGLVRRLRAVRWRHGRRIGRFAAAVPTSVLLAAAGLTWAAVAVNYVR